MNESFYSWLLVAVYAVAIVGIAWRSARRAKSMESFSVGSRNVSPVMVGLSLAASMTSAATFIVNPGLIYLYGWSGVLGYAVAAPLGIFLGLVVFSKSFRRVGDRFQVLTVPQWIGDRFGDRRLTVFYALLSVLQVSFLVLIVVGVTLALAKALAIPVTAALLGVVVFTFAYILLGGAGTHILTNTMQATIMIVVALVFLGSGLEFFRGGVGAFFERLAAVGPHYASAANPDSLLFRDLFEVVIANFVVGVAIILQPHIISKALYLKSEAEVNRYLLTAVGVSALFFAVLITGLFARLAMTGEVLKPDVVIPTYMVEHFSPFVRAVVVLGLISAGFSTLEGILVALSSIFANDLLKNVLPAGRDAEVWKGVSLKYARGFLVVLAPVTVWLSLRQIESPSLSVAIFAQNGVYGLFAANFAPILVGIFARGAIGRGWVLAASLSALAVHFGMYYGEVTQYHNNPAVPATFAILTSLAVVGVGLMAGRVRREAAAAPTAAASSRQPAAAGR